VRVGEVVTVRTHAKVLVTHRVTAVETSGASLQYTLHGDNNQDPDPRPYGAKALLGRVEGHLPALGFLVGILLTPGGLLAAFGWVATLILVGMALEGDRTGRATPGLQPTP
jgi:hypothetical protein